MSSQAKARREDKNKNYAQQMQEFANDSMVFFNKCAKPDKNGKCRTIYFLKLRVAFPNHIFSIEYMKILQACAMGFIVIGFIGYIIKLVFIPINNIILGA